MAQRDLSEEELLQLLSNQHGVPSVKLDDVQVAPDVLAHVPAEIALRHQLLPMNVDDESPTLVVAMADPSDAAVIDEIQRQTGLTVEVVVAPPSRVRRAIDRHYFPS
jgi:type IV pilus assembly protein PilB